jgi:hypothetical protein
MENPTEKKRFPWGWVAAGCAAAAVLALAAVAVIGLVVFPAARNVIASRSPSLNPLPTLQVGSTAVPNQGSGGGSSIGNLPFKFSAVQDPATLPNQSLMDQMTTTLNLNNDTDFMAPKTYKGTAILDLNTGFTLGNAWCAKDSTTLQQNLANMQFQLSINGTSIDLSQYPDLYLTSNQGEACALTGISITPSGNLSGSYHVVLTQKYVTSLNDGITSSLYPAGDVTFDFTIRFQNISNPGSGT